jgi:hypothetical protein
LNQSIHYLEASPKGPRKRVARDGTTRLWDGARGENVLLLISGALPE